MSGPQQNIDDFGVPNSASDDDVFTDASNVAPVLTNTGSDSEEDQAGEGHDQSDSDPLQEVASPKARKRKRSDDDDEKKIDAARARKRLAACAKQGRALAGWSKGLAADDSFAEEIRNLARLVPMTKPKMDAAGHAGCTSAALRNVQSPTLDHVFWASVDLDGFTRHAMGVTLDEDARNFVVVLAYLTVFGIVPRVAAQKVGLAFCDPDGVPGIERAEQKDPAYKAGDVWGAGITVLGSLGINTTGLDALVPSKNASSAANASSVLVRAAAAWASAPSVASRSARLVAAGKKPIKGALTFDESGARKTLGTAIVGMEAAMRKLDANGRDKSSAFGNLFCVAPPTADIIANDGDGVLFTAVDVASLFTITTGLVTRAGCLVFDEAERFALEELALARAESKNKAPVKPGELTSAAAAALASTMADLRMIPFEQRVDAVWAAYIATSEKSEVEHAKTASFFVAIVLKHVECLNDEEEGTNPLLRPGLSVYKKKILRRPVVGANKSLVRRFTPFALDMASKVYAREVDMLNATAVAAVGAAMAIAKTTATAIASPKERTALRNGHELFFAGSGNVDVVLTVAADLVGISRGLAPFNERPGGVPLSGLELGTLIRANLASLIPIVSRAALVSAPRALFPDAIIPVVVVDGDGKKRKVRAPRKERIAKIKEADAAAVVAKQEPGTTRIAVEDTDMQAKLQAWKAAHKAKAKTSATKAK